MIEGYVWLSIYYYSNSSRSLPYAVNIYNLCSLSKICLSQSLTSAAEMSCYDIFNEANRAAQVSAK